MRQDEPAGTEHELDAQIDREMGWDKLPGRKVIHAPNPAVVALLRIPLGIIHCVWWVIRSLVKAFFFILFFPVFTPLRVLKKHVRSGVEQETRRSIPSRLVEAVLIRSLVFSLVVISFFMVLVYLTTRPASVQAMESPAGEGLYYQRVNLLTSDGQQLRGWYVPPLTPDDVVLDQAQSFTQKWPAAVLAHGLGYSHDQYLALAARLNGLGFAVLLLDTRGQGESPEAAVTFGLREQRDVQAGVGYLRSLPTTDAARLCVVGEGINAAAALRTVASDATIAAVIADSADPDFAARIETFIPGPKPLPRITSSLYRSTFEATLGEKTADLRLEATVASIHYGHLLFVARPDDESAVNNALSLSDATEAKHELLIARQPQLNGSLVALDEREEARFLCESCNWTPPIFRRQQAVRALLDHQVK